MKRMLTNEINTIKNCDCVESLCCCGKVVERSASSDLSQNQGVLQVNMNLQTAAIAIATNGQTAKASQQNCQTNTDIRAANVIATSCDTLTCNDICADSDLSFSASDQQDRQDIQVNISVFGVNTAIANTETAIDRDCIEQDNTTNEVRFTIATNCPSVEPTQADKSNHEGAKSQYNANENLDTVLDSSPLSSISINGKEIKSNIQGKTPTIKQIAFDANNKNDNTDKKPLALNFDKFHVILSLDRISLDVEANSDGNVLVDGKGVRK
ncbi:MAG: hypothetical protein GX022_06365 [Clostridiaceae bacterium]|nr:hypothetical protein [Clostridiaceae bacterium]